MELQVLELKIPPPVIAVLCAGLMWGTSQIESSPSLGILPEIFALLIAGLGVLIALVAVIAFLKRDTTINPHYPDQTSSLVTTGIYSLSRNPMYLAVLLVLSGWAIWLQNVAAILVLPLFPLYITAFQIKPEEEQLERKFGDQYREYCCRVRRWL